MARPSPRLKRRRLRITRRDIMFAALAALAALAVLEMFFRIGQFGREPYEDFYDNIYDVAYGMRPGAVNPYSGIREQINRHGFRGADYAVEKPPGVFRIVCIGDSCTFGINVSLEEAYPDRLEALLNVGDAEPYIQVINGGIPGTNIFQHLLVLRGRLVQFEPDLVIVWSAPNYLPSIRQFRESMNNPPFYVHLQKPLCRLATYRWLLRTIRRGPTERAYYEIASDITRQDEIRDRELGGNRLFLNDYLANLETLRQTADEYGFEPVFTNYPMRKSVLNEYWNPPTAWFAFAGWQYYRWAESGEGEAGSENQKIKPRKIRKKKR